MKFLWPAMLWLLALVPILAAAYATMLRRRRFALHRLSSLRMVEDAARDSPPWRRHVPAGMFLAGVTMALLAAARPEAMLALPLQEETVILAIDVSGSMRATDVYPDRLAAAQAAAKHFVAAKAYGTRVGVVEFGGTALLVQAPTDRAEDLMAAIDALEPRDSTAIGAAIMAALKAIQPRADFHDAHEAPPADVAPRARIEESAAIILLTDGENTVGPEPLRAARLAARHGIRVFTVGLGTQDGDLVPAGASMERVRLDEGSLREIARITGAEYFQADSLVELTGVYETLGSELVVANRRSELTLPLSAASALTLVLGAMLSLLWFNRIV